MKLSIIIPVYNVEPYIARCLDSCLNQDLDSAEYEIIVVDDGSPDRSAEIAEQFAETYPNIRIIHRQNGGLSAARNTGLADAHGEFVWFVDSDDRIDKYCIGGLFETASRNNLDVLCFGLKLEFPDGTIRQHQVRYEEDGKIYDGRDFICDVGMPPAAWSAIYRREFLISNDLKFYEGILHEDQEFTPRAYCQAKRIAYTDKHIYYYNQREGGIMKSSRNEKRCRDLLTVADSLYDFAIQNTPIDSRTYKSLLQRVYFNVTQSLAFYTPLVMPISEYKRRPYYPMDSALFSGNMRYKLLLANFSPTLYTLIHRWLKH